MKKQLFPFMALLLVCMVTLPLVFHTTTADYNFSDNFDDGNSDGWTKLGTWNVIDGKYCTDTLAYGISFVDSLTLTDCVIEAKLRFTNGIGFRGGIVFRFIDNENYYTFELSNEYDCVIFGMYTPQNPFYGKDPPPAFINFEKGAIQSSVDYTLRVEVRDNAFTGYVNGPGVNASLFWSDGTYASGKVGLRAMTARVAFDDFRINGATPQPTPTPNPTGLSAYWRFDEGSGITATDSSGYGNTGTLVNGPQWTDGKFGKAIEFDGIDDYITVPDSQSLRVQSFTLSAWVYMTVRPYQAGHPSHPHVCIINKLHYYNTNAKAGYKLDFEYPTASDDTLVLTIGDGAAQRFLVQYNSINDLTLNKWHHIAGTYDGSQAVLYIDGQVKASGQGSYTISHDNTPLCLSREISQPDYDGFKGKIDEVGIYYRALSADEIALLYSSPVPSPTPQPSTKSAPIPAFSYSPSKPSIKETVTFDALGSVDLDGNIVNYQWDFGDGTATAENTPQVTHVYNEVRTYNVSLLVTDNDGLASTISRSVDIGELRVNHKIEYEFETLTPYSIRITLELKFEIDNSPVEDAIVKVNQVTAEHIGNGKYTVTINTLMPTLAISTTVERKGALQLTSETEVLLQGNTIVLASVIGVPSAIFSVVVGKRVHKKYEKAKIERNRRRRERQARERQERERAQQAAREKQERERAREQEAARQRTEQARQQREREDEHRRFRQHQQQQTTTSTKDPYAVLGVPRTATNAQVKDAYRRLARKWHPDTFGKHGDPRVAEMANEKLREINEAYETIKRLKGWS